MSIMITLFELAVYNNNIICRLQLYILLLLLLLLLIITLGNLTGNKVGSSEAMGYDSEACLLMTVK